MYQKVLVPLDGSDTAECALSHLKTLIQEGSVGEATLLNIVKIDIPWAEMQNKTLDINALRESLFASSGKYLAGVESRLSPQGVKIKKESIESNRPANTIAEYAQQHNMDLIILATHGYTGLKKLVLGSVASGVLNQSAVPVLLIRPAACRL
jgi:nucleotide-binding universal stress UspA family protein